MSARHFKVKEFGAHNKRVVFFFAGMGTSTWMYTRPIQKMVASGFHVFAYDFDTWLVHRQDPDTYVAVAENVLKDVKQQIKTLKATSVTDFNSFGFSMGTILAIRTAAELPEIKRVIIMLTYGSVAENIWTWKFIRPARRRAIKQGYTMQTLDQKLAPFSPIPLASKLKGKKILLYLALRDKIILQQQSKQFKAALDAAKIDYTYIENAQFGHNLSAYQNFKDSATWLEFLNS